MEEASLFDSAETWLSDPVEAFSAWLVSSEFAVNKRGEPQELRASSITVYRSMFGKFNAQALAADTSSGRPGKTLPQVTTEDIRAFLDGNQLKSGIRQRYVRLLERTFDLLASKDLVGENPARALAVKQPRASGQGNDSMQWLSAEQQAAFVAALPAGNGWKEKRSRAMIATVLGGGLKVSEVIGLETRNVGARQADGSLLLEVRPGGAGRWHRTRVLPFAAAILAEWVKLREGLKLSGELLFPSGPGGAPLHPATVYRQVRAVLADAGIPEDVIKRRGARTLRNTFAISELAEGQPAELVGEYLGHRADRSTRYYVELLPKRPR